MPLLAIEPTVTEVTFADGPHPTWEEFIRNGVRQSRLEIPLDIFLAALADNVLGGEPPAGFNASAPEIRVVEMPTIFLFVNGPPLWQPLEDSGLDGTWYLSAAGRWFSSAEMSAKHWTLVKSLPEAFQAIPPEHSLGFIRASIPGTVEARMAAPGIEVTYDDAPDFQSSGAKGVSRAVNTQYFVFLVDEAYYLCYECAWYQSAAADGPWVATADVPDAIYQIPPSSPPTRSPMSRSRVLPPPRGPMAPAACGKALTVGIPTTRPTIQTPAVTVTWKRPGMGMSGPATAVRGIAAWM